MSGQCTYYHFVGCGPWSQCLMSARLSPPNAYVAAEWILGKTNIAFMSGPLHKALRKSFLALFTRKALGLYVLKQDAIIRQNFDEWMSVRLSENAVVDIPGEASAVPCHRVL